MRGLSVCLLAIILLAVWPEAALAQESNIASGLLGRFVSQTDGWWGILRGYALFLFTTTLIIEVCLFGIRMALHQSNIGEIFEQFVMLLLFASFIAAVITNYQEWTTGIAVKGLQPLTGELTGNSVDAGQPVAMAAAIMEKIIPVMEEAGWTDFGEVYLYVSCMLIIMIVFVLISALVILCTCEFYIIANIGVLLIGLGGSKIFKDYAINVMRYILAVAVKLFVLQLIVNIGFAIISLNDLDSSVGNTLDTIKFSDLFFLIGKAIILLALAKSLPDTCAGIINGSAAGGGGNPMSGLVRSAGGMAMTAVSGGAATAVGMLKGVNAAHNIARSEAKKEGTSGLRDTGRRMIQAGVGAFKDARAGAAEQALQRDQGSMKNHLVSKSYASKAMNIVNDEDSKEPPNNDGQTSLPTPAPNAAGNSSLPSPAPASPDKAVPADSSGVSGEAAPVANGVASLPPPPKQPSRDDYYDPRPLPKGTVDMTTFDPSMFQR